MVQAAEGALEEITNNLQRVRELALESANATNNAADRDTLDGEVQQRLEDVNRIARQTDFNGLKILDGSRAGCGYRSGRMWAIPLRSILIPVFAGSDRRAGGGGLALKCAAFTNGELDTPATITLGVDGDDLRGIAREAGATIENMVATIENAEVAGRTSVAVKNGALRLRVSDEIARGSADLATVFDGPPKTINKSGSLHGAGISSED